MRERFPRAGANVFRWHNTLNLHFTDGESRIAGWRTAPGTTSQPDVGTPTEAHTDVNAVAVRKLFVTRLVESDYTTEWHFKAALS
jgi:hypothetical protein